MIFFKHLRQSIIECLMSWLFDIYLVLEAFLSLRYHDTEIETSQKVGSIGWKFFPKVDWDYFQLQSFL